MGGNTFHGSVYEFPGIGVDKFNLKDANFYLLTHFHADHLVGLKNQSFSSKIYCTRATALLLALDPTYSHVLPYCIPLDFKSHNIPYKDTQIRLSLIDSYHCPGSTLFLIEGNNKAVLITGDVRAEDWWIQESLKRNPILSPYVSGVKTLDNIYLDTSFAYRGEPFIEIPSNILGIRLLTQLLNEYPKDDEEIQFHFMDHVLGFEESWANVINALDGSVTIQDNLQDQILALKNSDLNCTVLCDLQAKESSPKFNVSRNLEGCKLPIRIDQCIDFNILDWVGTLFPVHLASLSEVEIKSLSYFKETLKGHKVYEFRNRTWVLPKNGNELLPTSVKLMFSRHSSFSETRKLVSLFRPKQVYPCSGVSEITWKNGFSISRIFGDLCSGKSVYDSEMLKTFGEPLVTRKHAYNINRWEFKDCGNEMEFVEEVSKLHDPNDGNYFIPIEDFEFKGISYSKKHSDYVKKCMDMKLQNMISGRGEASYRKRISEYQRIYSNIQTEVIANLPLQASRKALVGYNDESDFEGSSNEDANLNETESTQSKQDSNENAEDSGTTRLVSNETPSKSRKLKKTDSSRFKPSRPSLKVKPVVNRSQSELDILKVLSSFRSQEISFRESFETCTSNKLTQNKGINLGQINHISSTLEKDPSVWFSFNLSSMN